MDPLKTSTLRRDVIAEFIKSPAGVRNYEAIQDDTTNIYAAITGAPFLTLDDDPNLGSERVFTPVVGELLGTDGGVGGGYTLGLADTAVVAGDYGDASHFITASVDAKGRITNIAAIQLNTTNITEGSKLFYTDTRARAALTGGSGINYNNVSGVIATTGFSGTVSPVTSITVVNGIVTAVT